MFLRILFILTAGCLLRQSLYAQSSSDKTYTDSLLKALNSSKDDTVKIKTLYELSNAFANYDSASALNYAAQCLKSAQQKNWQKGVGLAYRAFGFAYYTLSDYSTSIQYFKKGLIVFQKLHDKMNEARLLSNIGDDYGGTGLYTESLNNYLTALKLFEAVNYTDGISAEYNNIGIDYYNLLQYEKAIKNYKNALHIDEQLTDTFAIASDYDNIAVVYLEEKKPDSANTFNVKAVKLFEQINDLPALSKAYINRGNILLQLHNAASAYNFYNQSLSINKKLNIAVEIASCYNALGNLYYELGSDSSSEYITAPFMQIDKRSLYKKANDYALNAFELGRRVNDISRLMSYSLLLSQTNKKLGNFEAALNYHEQYAAYKDSIFNDVNRKKVEAMEQERLAETKDQQIALQTSEFKRQSLIKNIILLSVIFIAALAAIIITLYNRRKKIKFDKQVMEVEMKALRSQMNPHFIFNSLHSINNYVMENDRQKASDYLIKFSGLMRFILESSREKEVSLETDLQALELYMQLEALQSKKTFAYKIETEKNIDKENILIPPMLLQPFVENAILHGIKNKENGFIKIKVREENEMICFEIEDNGSGIKDNAGSKMHKSLAKKIVDERLDIINHLQKEKASVQTFNITDNEIIKGVKVKLLLPLKLAF